MSQSTPQGFAVIPIWLLRSQSVTAHAKTVFLHLSSRVNEDNNCWPSQSTIASDSCLGLRTVQRAVKELQTLGLVEVRTTITPTGRRNDYTLRVDRFGQGGAAT